LSIARDDNNKNIVGNMPMIPNVRYVSEDIPRISEGVV
jgi:hypothetical protein